MMLLAGVAWKSPFGRKHWLPATAVVLATAFAGTLIAGPQASPAGGVSWSATKEKALGRKLAEQIKEQHPLLDDERVRGYLEQLEARLNPAGNGRRGLEVELVRDDHANATALPGGYLLVASGLIAWTRSESELAAVLAHEIGHIEARHGLRAATNPAGGETAAPLIFLGGWNGVCTRFAPVTAYPIAYRANSTGFEKVADEIGRERLARAGFDPAAMTRVFKRLATEGANGNSGRRDEAGSRDQSSPAFDEIKARTGKLTLPNASTPPSLFRARN